MGVKIQNFYYMFNHFRHGSKKPALGSSNSYSKSMKNISKCSLKNADSEATSKNIVFRFKYILYDFNYCFPIYFYKNYCTD